MNLWEEKPLSFDRFDLSEGVGGCHCYLYYILVDGCQMGSPNRELIKVNISRLPL
jgi:hypothetical protein